MDRISTAWFIFLKYDKTLISFHNFSSITKIKNQGTWRSLLLELLMPEKEPEILEGNFRTVAGLIYICLAEGEKVWT